MESSPELRDETGVELLLAAFVYLYFLSPVFCTGSNFHGERIREEAAIKIVAVIATNFNLRALGVSTAVTSLKKLSSKRFARVLPFYEIFI